MCVFIFYAFPLFTSLILGLDPAFPLYIFQGARGHLTKGDAKFVDVIHTDGGMYK